MAKIHLVEGSVGAGKSTFSLKLEEDLKGVHFSVDDWMTALFRPDRPNTDVLVWYSHRKKRCIEQILKVANKVLSSDTDVILELGLINKDLRKYFLEIIALKNHSLEVYVLDAPRDVRKIRVKKRNIEKGKTFSMEVPDNIFEMASDMWEPVTNEDFRGEKINYISTNG